MESNGRGIGSGNGSNSGRGGSRRNKDDDDDDNNNDIHDCSATFFIYDKNRQIALKEQRWTKKIWLAVPKKAMGE